MPCLCSNYEPFNSREEKGAFEAELGCGRDQPYGLIHEGEPKWAVAAENFTETNFETN